MCWMYRARRWTRCAFDGSPMRANNTFAEAGRSQLTAFARRTACRSRRPRGGQQHGHRVERAIPGRHGPSRGGSAGCRLLPAA
jgi:hypothetical protein